MPAVKEESVTVVTTDAKYPLALAKAIKKAAVELGTDSISLVSSSGTPNQRTGTVTVTAVFKKQESK